MTGNDRAGDSGRWDAAYGSGDRDRSWYQSHADVSMGLIRSAGTSSDAVIDVGGGASTLVDDLIAADYDDISVLDISVEGLDIARRRLGAAAAPVRWIAEDLTTWQPHREFDIWHDRAVLHFLVEPEQLAAYQRALFGATKPGSRVIIGVFGPSGPNQCSGLKVRRYDPLAIEALLGSSFTIEQSFVRDHHTPSAANQQFLWTAATRSQTSLDH